MKKKYIYLLAFFFFLFCYLEQFYSILRSQNFSSNQNSNFSNINQNVLSGDSINKEVNNENKEDDLKIDHSSIIDDVTKNESAIEDVANIAKEEKKKEPEGVIAETVNFSSEEVGTQGNWVKKREWLKEALKINDEIAFIVDKIQNFRKPFDDKFFEIDSELDKFYMQEGLEQGKTKELFDDLYNYLEKKREEEQERARRESEESGITGEYEIKLDIIESNIKDSRDDLEQLKLDMQTISDLDKSLNAHIKKLNEYINTASQIKSTSQKLVDKIWYVIDDKIARSIFYDLKDNYLVRVNAIKNYIQIDLQRNFDGVVSLIKSQITKVKEGLKEQEKKGFIIKNRARRLRSIKLEELEGRKIEKNTEKEFENLLQRSWYQKIYDFIVDIVAKLYSFLSNI